MPKVFINGISLEETDPVKLRTILRDKIGVSLCFLDIPRYTHLLFYADELIPVDSTFEYSQYDEVVKQYKLKPFNYRKVAKCVNIQDTEVVEHINTYKRYVLKKAKRDRTIEAVILANCNHPNIIELHELFVYNGELFIIQDYAPYGDLFEYIAVKGNDLSNSYNEIIMQIVDGIEYLHSKGYAHLDLKLDNIVIKSINPVKVALIDFELSYAVPFITDRQFGTLDYMPPEIAKRSRDKNYIYDKDCDIWTVGVIILILFHNAQFHPFGSTEMEQFRRGTENPMILRRQPYWPKAIPKKFKDIAEILFTEREHRPSITQVKQLITQQQ